MNFQKKSDKNIIFHLAYDWPNACWTFLFLSLSESNTELAWYIGKVSDDWYIDFLFD